MKVTLHTKCGELTGLKGNDCLIFRGIPYAKTERFERPVLIRHWDGTLDATRTELDCYQYSSYNEESKGANNFYYKEFRSERQFRYGESPMELNIITPPDAKNCPVLLFFHGGGFETGTVGELPYGTCREYAKRDVIFVSTGYRLNVFALYKGKNLGLHDQIAAIFWIRENIKAFGGDPSRITLIGQSAGAMSIQNLLWSRKLESVISGAVLMSGGALLPKALGPKPPTAVEELWNEVRNQAGAATDEELKQTNAKTLWQAWEHVRKEKGNFTFRQPAVDKDIIPDDPHAIVKANRDLDIPLIYGMTSQDFMPLAMYKMILDWGVNSARRGKQPVWAYCFDRTLPGNSFRAFHGADLWYLFGNMEQSWRPFEETDARLKNQMADAIAQFVKFQTPNGEGLPEWKPLAPGQKGFRHFDGASDGYIYPGACIRKALYTALFDKGPCEA